MTELKEQEYSFVLDTNGNKLSPCKVNKAWYLIRKGKAKQVDKFPMIIQLNRGAKEIKDSSEFICGIDDGSKFTGIALVQKCKTKNKVIFKGTIEHRQDVKYLMEVRKNYRRYRRNHKRYRKIRFSNRGNSKRKGRIATSIKQKKDATLRVIKRLNKWVNINEIHLEDVQIDIRKLTEGNKIYAWQYQTSNRLDENLRKATLIRDKFKCIECGKDNCKLETHHIVPKRLKGNNSINNLVMLCCNCHSKITGKEEKYIKYFQDKIKGKNIMYGDAMHVMQGKNYFRKELSRIAEIQLTVGSTTANRRINLNIDKSHSNDAVIITGLDVDRENCEIKDWAIKPMRNQSKARTGELKGFRHRDLVKYIKRNGEVYVGYITALYSTKNLCNITTVDKFTYKKYGINNCKLIWRFNKIYFI